MSCYWTKNDVGARISMQGGEDVVRARLATILRRLRDRPVHAVQYGLITDLEGGPCTTGGEDWYDLLTEAHETIQAHTEPGVTWVVRPDCWELVPRRKA